MTFFWRIFLSVWAIVLITFVAMNWAANWLPWPGNGVDSVRFPEQVVDLIARDLRARLATNPTTAARELAEDQRLDFSPMLNIYVLDPQGKDVLGRSLPDDVAEIAHSEAGLPASRSKERQVRLHVRDQGLEGYRIVGDEGYFPIGDAMTRPWARGMLILFMLVVSVIVSLVLARFIVLPVRRLRRAGQKVAKGDLTVRVAPTVGSRTDDIARLAREFDVMTGRIDALLQSQQRLMRDVSHELRSPLARLQALFSIARQNAGSEGARQIDRMEAELERLDDLIGEILAFTRLEVKTGIERHPTDLVDLLQNIVDDASLEAQASGKQIHLGGPARCVVHVDSGLIQSAVENIVRNALKHTDEGSSVQVDLAEDENCVRITVNDQGPGVPEDAIDKIFEPFYRVGDSRGTGSGSGGIGLAIAERSIHLHGGRISARNREGGGLGVAMVLPKPPRG